MSTIWWRLIRLIARICTGVYYRSFRVEGADRIPRTGPVLFVANHPNSLVDAGAVLRAVPRPVSFAAKNTLFSVRIVGWMLRKLGAVPVYRPRDRTGRARDNMRMFAAFTELFRRGGATVIYPEGHSHLDPELKEVKSGPARIALDAERDTGFTLGLKVVPLGLHYEPHQQFRGEAHVRVGEPFEVADLEDEPRLPAIRAVQARIADSLQPLLLHLDDTTLEPLVRGVAEVYDEHQRAHPSELEPRTRGELVQTAGACLNHFLRADPAAVRIAHRKLERYQRLARRTGVRAEALAGHERPLRSWFGAARMLVGLVLGFPLYVLGCLTSYVPYRLTDSIARRKSDSDLPVDLPILRIAAGAVCFGVFWGLLLLVAFLWSKSVPFTLFFFGLLLVCAFVARYYAARAVVWRERLAGMFGGRRVDRVSAARGDLLQFVGELVRRYETDTGRWFLPPRRVKWYQRVPWRTIAGVALVGLVLWFAWGLRDRELDELSGAPSPWTEMAADRAQEFLDRDARSLASMLSTLESLEARMHELDTGLDEGRIDPLDPHTDDAVRRAFLTYLTCRGELFRLVWFYRSPARAGEPDRSRRAFLLSYGAGIELCRRGMQLAEGFEDQPRSVRKLNEGDAAWGIPAGTFDRIRRNLGNAEVYEELAAATAHYRALRAALPESGGPWPQIVAHADGGADVVGELADKRWGFKWDAAVARMTTTAEQSRYGMSRFFAKIIGGVRVRGGDLDDGLISKEQLAWLADQQLRPGDILLERRNWALTNLLLPGFWTHAALYIGDVEGLERIGVLDDPRVRPHREALGRLNARGQPPTVIEAVGAGVILNSLEVSVGEADAVCVLRPRLPEAQVHDAVARAIWQHGKPYDFDFDFSTTDRLVCTELVHHAYQGPIAFDLEEIMGRKTLPAIGILRKWARERGREDAQLDVVCFLDALEDEGVAAVGDEARLLETLDRPGLTLLQERGGGSSVPRTVLIVLSVLALAALLFVRRRP